MKMHLEFVKELIVLSFLGSHCAVPMLGFIAKGLKPAMDVGQNTGGSLECHWNAHTFSPLGVHEDVPLFALEGEGIATVGGTKIYGYNCGVV